jgi:hypothetical protein
LFESIQNFSSNVIRAQLARHDLIQSLIDQLFGAGFLPDPSAGGAVDNFTSAVGQPAAAPTLELTRLLEILVVPIEGRYQFGNAITLCGRGE